MQFRLNYVLLFKHFQLFESYLCKVISKLNTLGAIFLLIVVLYGTTHKTWIRISYEINKLEIIDKFCINKEVTTYSCDGKCHLKTKKKKSR